MERVLFALLAFAAASSAHAAGLSVVYGQGDHVDVYAAELHSGDWRRWDLGSGWRASLHGVGGVGYWRAREQTEHKELWDFAAGTALRVEEQRAGGVAPYVEASFGAHLLSRRQINGNRAFSTAFQFGEYVAAGVRFGSRQQFDAALRLQHVSNGGIRNPNPGLTYTALALQYRF